MAELRYDPMDVALDIAPYDVWRRMRDEAPVYRNDELDFYALSRYDDVAAALRDTATYSSTHGTVLELMTDQPHDGGMMIFRDPPDHTRYRSLVSRAFTVKRISDLSERIEGICDELLEPWVPGEEFDFVQDFSHQLPSKVITHLLGIPESDRLWARERIDSIFHLDPDRGMVNDVSATASLDLVVYMTDLMERRQASPADDLLSGLAGAGLSVEESVQFAMLLTVAGTETVGRLLGWACVLLDEHADQRAELVADPTLVPNAVEEVLRFEGPSPVQARWTLRDVELHGEVIPAGSKVLLLTSSAGRDGRKYADPDRFDIHRDIEHHVSFGYGVHFCLGAALARLESRTGLTKALAKHPEWEVQYERGRRAHTSTVRGWESIPVR